jgi:DNA-binding NarL/FixJ family response regulator
MGAVNALLDAAGRLYASALQPAEWTAALDVVVGLLGGGHAILVANDTGQTMPFVATARLAEDHRALFLAPESAPLFAPFQAVTPPPRTVLLRQQIMGDTEFERTAAYNEVVRPADGFHSISAFERGAGGFALNICRGRNRGMFDAGQVGIAQTLIPHLATALEFRRRLHGGDGHSGLTRLLDGVTQGAVLADAAGRPGFANRRAAAILGEGDGMRLGADGLLAAASPATTRALRDAVAAVSAGNAATGRRLRLQRPGRPPLLVSVMPVWRLAPTLHGIPSPAAAIFISEPDAPPAIDREALAETYGLTRRECDVALLLADGLTLPAIAERLGLTLGAVRQYLARAFDKTGRRNQAALVALLRGYATRYN